MSNDQAEYINVEEASERLGISPRQVHRYAAERGRLRTRKAGRRVLFHAGDVEQLAQDLGAAVAARPPKPPKQELMAPGPLLDHIRALEQNLHDAARVEGYLRAQLDQQRLALEDQQRLQQELDRVRQERDTLQAQLDALKGARRPWWKFW